MEHPSQDQPNNLPPTQDKVPHGGERPDFELGPLNTGEVPRLVKELDARKTVPDALVGRTKIEDTVDALAATTYESSVDTQPGKGLSRSAKIGAAVAAVFLTAVSVFGIGKALDNGGESNLPPEDEPVATAPVNPSDEATPSAAETSAPQPGGVEDEPVTTSAFEVSGELTPEKAAEVIVGDRISKWTMAGANQDTINKYFAASKPSDATDKIAADNKSIIADALFIPTWNDGNHEQLADYVDFETNNNSAVLQAWVLTKEGGFPQDHEPYVRTLAVDSVSVESEQEDSAIINVAATEKDNSDQNRGEELLNGKFSNNNRIAGKITIQKINQTWKIAAIEWTSR